ncbi:unnamed protein product [Ectocarpus sp. 12 AP-2014]
MVGGYVSRLFYLILGSSTTTSAWVFPGTGPARALSRHQVRHTTPLAGGTVGDYMGKGNSDEDDAAAAAREARESLERMWASSAGASGQDEEEEEDEDEDDGQLLREVRQALPELEGEGAETKRENPFPTSSDRGALEASSASQQALLAGKRGLIIDVEVRQMDDTHAEFDEEMQIDFVTDISKALATVSGRVKVLLRGIHLAEKATEMLQKANTRGEEEGIEPRRDISFCSFQMANTDDEDDEKSMRDFASTLGLANEEERVFLMVCPRRLVDVTVLREIILAAKGRPVVLITPRMPYMPVETDGFETVYQLKQYNVQPVPTNPKKRIKNVRLTRLGQNQQTIYSELGQVIPRVLVTRAFPGDFKLYLDIDGKGFQLEKTYDSKPQPAVVSFTAQNKIREVQQRVTLQHKRVVAKDHGVEDDDDFDWDTINDDLEEGEEPFVMPPMPTEDEINARLRDD